MKKIAYLIVLMLILTCVGTVSATLTRSLAKPDGYWCSGNAGCTSGHCVHNICRASNPYCGDNYCDAGEDCNSCGADCKGCNGGACTWSNDCESGHCVHNVCRADSYHCGDGFCDWNEKCKADSCCNGRTVDMNTDKYNCGSCGRQCEYKQECNNGECRDLCGNGRIDAGESQWNCCEDAGCGSGKVCDKSSHQCVECVSDNDCSGLKCFKSKCVECVSDQDCKETINWFGEGTCKNNKILTEKGEKFGGDCNVNLHTCQGTKIPTTREVDCPTFCHETKCGCPEGYKECYGNMNKCVKIKGSSLNDPCACDFQCESDFCYNGKCFEALSADITTDNLIAEVGERLKVTIGVVNKLDEAYKMQIIMTVGSGVSFTGGEGAESCSGYSCTATVNFAEKGSKDIVVYLEGNNPVEVPLTAKIEYVYQGTAHSLEVEEKTIELLSCGDEKCSAEIGETSENCCSDCGIPNNNIYSSYICPTVGQGYERNVKWANVVWTFVIIVIIVLLVLGSIYGKKLRHERETRRDKAAASKEKENTTKRRERNRIRKAINAVDDHITSKKSAPSLGGMKRRIKKKLGSFDFDDRLFKEEYLNFLEELEEKEKVSKKKGPKFCRKCGAELKKGKKFCTKCGARA